MPEWRCGHPFAIQMHAAVIVWFVIFINQHSPSFVLTQPCCWLSWLLGNAPLHLVLR